MHAAHFLTACSLLLLVYKPPNHAARFLLLCWTKLHQAAPRLTMNAAPSSAGCVNAPHCTGRAKHAPPAQMDVVAEMMIWANSAVAQFTAAAFPGAALLRNHPPPQQEAFEQVGRMDLMCSRAPIPWP